MVAVDFAVDKNFRRYESKHYPLPEEWQKPAIKSNLLKRLLNKILSPFIIYKRNRSKIIRFQLKFDKKNYLFQSAYAKDTFKVVYKLNAGLMLTDYINVNDFKDTSSYHMCKCSKKHVTYFPSKSQSLMELIFEINSENQDLLHFISIKNLPKNHVVALLSEADLYLDLGFFPGRDRLPREAILLECPVLLARRGSARYFVDFPIPDNYLVDLAVVPPRLLYKKILEHLDVSKSAHLKAQVEFKNAVLGQKLLFKKEVKEFLNYIKSLNLI